MRLTNGAPFLLMGGDNLGINEISQKLSPLFIPSQKLGSANIVCALNAANGNVFIEDHLIKITEAGGDVNLGYCYNSQAKNIWQFSVEKIIFQADSSDKVFLQEKDGRVVSYSLNKKTNEYHSDTFSDAKYRLYFDQNKHQWVRKKYGNDATEYYGLDGKLIVRTDKRGYSIYFDYDDEGRLKSFKSSDGVLYLISYKITETGQTVIIERLENQKKQELKSLEFDQYNRLKKSKIDDYWIEYDYVKDTNIVHSIKQSNGTLLTFSHDESLKNISRIKFGEGEDAQIFNLQKDEDDNSFSVIMEQGDVYRLFLNQKSEVVRSEIESTLLQIKATYQFDYYLNGQLEEIIDPASQTQAMTYDELTGLMSSVKDEEGEKTIFHYSVGPDPILIGRSKALKTANLSKNLTEQFIYETKGNLRLLRFTITPMGRVKEYRYEEGLLQKIIEYTDSTYPETQLLAEATALDNLNAWVAERDINKTLITKITENTRGQIISRQQFVNFTKEGIGVDDDEASYETFKFNDANEQLSHGVRHSLSKMAEEKQEFDLLGRYIEKENALHQKTRYRYGLDYAGVHKILPNGRQELTKYNTRDAKISHYISAKDGEDKVENHHTTYRYYGAKVNIETNPQGDKTAYFYDEHNELCYRVSPTGIVTQCLHNREKQFQETRVYNDRIDVEELYENQTLELNQLLSLIPPDAKFQRNIEFYDAQLCPLLTIDADNYLTNTVYDSLHRPIATLKTKINISNSLVDQLKIDLTTLNMDDFPSKITRKFYDDDGLLIAETNQLGHLTYYVRDGAGLIRTKIVYQEKFEHLTTQTTLDDLNINQLTAHAITKYYRDRRGQIIAELNPGGYLTTYKYTANGLKQQEIKYEKKISVDWDKEILPIPEISINDRFINYEYDQLNRIERRISQGKDEIFKYDEMGNVIYSQTIDAFSKDKKNADYQRQTYAKYDDFDRKYTELNTHIADKLMQIEADPSLSPEQIAHEKNLLWKKQSTKYTHNHLNLLTQTTDSLGHTTRYFYDSEKNLIATVDPMGAVVQKTYNAHDQCEILRKYKNRLSQKILLTLNEKIANADLLVLLEANQSEEDNITKFQFNARNRVEKKTDAKGYVSLFSYDEDVNLVSELLPIGSKDPTLFILHELDAMGNEIGLKKIAGQLRSSIKKEFNHPSGLLTKSIDEMGLETVISYDNLDRIETITTGNRCLTLKYDAFGRIFTERDALGYVTTHSYNDRERSHTITHPDFRVVEYIKKNVFNETILMQNALNQAEIFYHAPDGQICAHQDPLNQLETFAYDSEGKKKSETGYNGIVTEYKHNESGQLVKKLIDVKGTLATIDFEPNAYGLVEKITDPNGVITINKFNSTDHLIQSILDPSTDDKKGLNIINQYSTNAMGEVVEKVIGDKEKLNQHQEKILQDEFGRVVGTLIDPKTQDNPDGLEIKRTQKLNAKNKAILEEDGNGAVTYHFYNQHQELIATVYPGGRVVRWDYNSLGKINFEYHYARRLDLAEINTDLTLAKLSLLLNNIKHATDSCRHYHYDEMGREKYTVDIHAKFDHVTKSYLYKGIVTERQYNPVGKEICTIDYANAMPLEDSKLFDTPLVSKWTKENADLNQTVISYYYYDANGRERYHVTKNGKIEEKRYNKNGKLIAQIIYYKRFPEPAKFLAMTGQAIDEVIACIADSKNDRATHFIYDLRDRQTHVINAKNGVTRHEYDHKDNIIKTVEFKNPLQILNHRDDDAIHDAALRLAINEIDDTVSEFKFDADDRLQEAKDPLKNSESYIYDALKNTTAHTNRRQQTWRYNYDRASRLVAEFSPLTTVTSINKATPLFLTHSEQKAVVIKQYSNDREGNVTKIVEGVGLSGARVHLMEYNDDHQIVETCIPNTIIDDPTKIAQFENLPITKDNIKKKNFYNGKRQLIAEKNEDGSWQYYVYDSLGRLIYEINKNGMATATTYNDLNHITSMTQYANSLSAKLFSAEKPEEFETILADNLTPNTELDRVHTFYYDEEGNVHLIVKGSIFYFSDGKLDVGCPTTEKIFNVFGECITESKLIKVNKWARTLFWYDQLGKVIAQVDPNLYLTIYKRDAFGKEIYRFEYATALNAKPDINLDVQSLQNLVAPSSNDRIYKYDYDKLGNKIEETDVTDFYYQFKKQPQLELEKIGSPTKKYFSYDPMENNIKITLEDGAVLRQYYDERGYLVAKTDVTRTANPIEMDLSLITPLTTFGINPFGQQIRTTRHKNSAKKDDPILPVVASDPNDQIQLTSIDDRGLTALQQNAEQFVKAFTYTAGGKIAREFHKTKAWINGGQSYTYHIDEHKYVYLDNGDRPIQNFVLRDNTIIFKTSSVYNTFGDLVGEGYVNTDSLKVMFDSNGKRWFSNQSGTPSILLHDLVGNETLTLKAPDIDLTKFSYQLIPNLMQFDTATLLRTEKIFDLTNYTIAIKSPTWDEGNLALPSRSYQCDRWGNIVEETDNAGNKWTRLFNHRNLELAISEPMTYAVGANNMGRRLRPWAVHALNKRDQLIGEINTCSHTKFYCLDEAGQLITEVLGDGTIATENVYDIFGNHIKLYESTYKSACVPIVYGYDRLNQPISLKLASGITQYYEYDADKLVSMTDTNYHPHRFNYFNEDIIARFEPMGGVASMEYDGKHFKVLEIRPDSFSKEWKRDYWGRIEKSKDLGGLTTTFSYNFLGDMIKEEAEASQYSFKINTQITYPLEVDGGLGKFPVINRKGGQFLPLPKKIIYEYRKGLLKTVAEPSMNKRTEYTYDEEHRAKTLKVIESGVTIKEISQGYDELGRIVSIHDKSECIGDFPVELNHYRTYDEVGNIRYMGYYLQRSGYAKCCHPLAKEWGNWFLYDKAQRVTLNEGSLGANNVGVITAGKGCVMEYAGNLRIREKKISESGVPTITDLGYIDGELRTTATYYKLLDTIPITIYNTTLIKASYGTCDVEEYLETYHLDKTDINTSEVTTKDPNRRTLSSVFTKGKDVRQTTLFYYPSWDVSTGQVTLQDGGGVHTRSEYKIACQKIGEVVPWYARGSRQENTGSIVKPFEFGSSLMLYYPNGMVVGKQMTADETLKIGDPTDVYFGATHTGDLQTKEVVKGGKSPFSHTTYYFSTINKELMGSYTQTITPSSNCIGIYQLNNYMLLNHMQVHQAGLPCGYFPPEEIQFPSYTRPVGKISPPKDQKDGEPNPPPNLTTLPCLESQIYVVQEEDSIGSIVKKITGDEEFRYILLKRNPFLMKQPLRPGMVLVVPSYVPNTNRADNGFVLSSFLGIIQGSILPFIPPHKRKNKANWIAIFGKIILVAIAIAVAQYFAPSILTAAAHMGIILSATAANSAIAIDLVTGVLTALTEAAAQGFAIKFNWQQKFSLSEALEAGINASLNTTPLKVLKDSKVAIDVKLFEVLKIGGFAVSTQLLEMKLGLRKQFDPDAIATQLATMLASVKIEKIIGDGKAEMIEKNIATAASDMIIGHVIQHTPFDADVLTATALGNIVGEGLAGKMVEYLGKVTSSNDLTSQPKQPSSDTQLSTYSKQKQQARNLVDSRKNNETKTALQKPAPAGQPIKPKAKLQNAKRTAIRNEDPIAVRKIDPKGRTESTQYSDGEIFWAYGKGFLEDLLAPAVVLYKIKTGDLLFLTSVTETQAYYAHHPIQKIIDIGSGMKNKWRDFIEGNAIQRAETLGGLSTLAVGGIAKALGASLVKGIGSKMASGAIGARVAETTEIAIIRQRVRANIEASAKAREKSNFEIHSLITKIPSLDVSTEVDEAVFWSGRGNRMLAEFYASRTGKFTLEMTPGGKYMDSLNLFDRYPNKQAILPWERLSAKFAKGASGEVSVFINNSRPTSVFNRIEYPLLRENPSVKIKYSPEIEYQNTLNIR